MLIRMRPDSQTDVLWAVPTSGYGHVADEQPLPHIRVRGLSLTPMCGGESGQPGCGWGSVGLPSGRMLHGWPWRQRLFNLPRRSVNLYWRNVFRTRCNSAGDFNFAEQLDYSTKSEDGFTGECPLVRFSRKIDVKSGRAGIVDCIEFRCDISFSRFMPVLVPLFPEWMVNDANLPRLMIDVDLRKLDVQRSAAGDARLWGEIMENVSFTAGDTLRRSYAYEWNSL